MSGWAVMLSFTSCPLSRRWSGDKVSWNKSSVRMIKLQERDMCAKWNKSTPLLVHMSNVLNSLSATFRYIFSSKTGLFHAPSTFMTILTKNKKNLPSLTNTMTAIEAILETVDLIWPDNQEWHWTAFVILTMFFTLDLPHPSNFDNILASYMVFPPYFGENIWIHDEQGPNWEVVNFCQMWRRAAKTYLLSSAAHQIETLRLLRCVQLVRKKAGKPINCKLLSERWVGLLHLAVGTPRCSGLDAYQCAQFMLH